MGHADAPKELNLPPEIIEMNEKLTKIITTLFTFIQQQNVPVDRYLDAVRGGMLMDNDDDPQLVRFFDDFSKFATFSPEQILVFLNEQAAFEPQQWLFLKVLVEQFWQNSGVAFEDIPQQKPSVIVEVSSETAQQVMDDLNLHSGRKGTFRGKA